MTAVPERDIDYEPVRPDGDADALPKGVGADDEDEKPVSEDDALKALRGGDDVDDAEAARAAAIAERVATRLQRDPTGTRIGSVALFNGSVSVSGGFAVGPGALSSRADTRLSRVDSADLAEYVDFFCPPDGYNDALERLGSQRLVVLAAPPGTGREATAYNLLAEVLADTPGDDDGCCFRVANDSAVGNLTWEPPERGCGYVILLDDAPAGGAGISADIITEHWLTDMTARVREADSFLVLVSGPARGGLLDAGTRSSGLLVSLGLVDPARIIQRRVLGHEPEPDAVASLDGRLRDCGALGLLGEQPQPHVAVRIAEVIKAGGDLAAEVKALCDPTRQVHQWFNTHQDVPTRCFAMAAAALEDASYLAVADAAMDLYRLLVAVPEPTPDLRFRDRLTSDHPWLEVSVLSEVNEFGAVLAVPRVRFRDSLVQQAVLGYAWTYLDGFRPVLQKWLRRLVTHPDVDVRARTSVAAGVIAWSDYGYALHRYLRSWAGSQTRAVRQAAATAVDVAGTHPDLTEPMWTVLETWAADTASPFGRRLGLTAATVAGGLVGIQAPARAMAVLRASLDRPDWATLVPVGHSVLRLVEHGQADAVLTGLLHWSQPQDSSPFVAKALSVFSFVACQPGPDGVEPVLLNEAPRWQPRLVELWARALARKPAQTQALNALRDCLDRYGNGRGTAYANLRDVMLGVARCPGGHRKRLEWHLRQWADDRINPSTAASRLLTAITRMA
ncbi:hypothetical protein [Amycolatopsis sp. NPDC059021]|uniref:hypothetical protein n=1 Tax=Amycolatopsis sp. NPDC059021 TaxID=3346704 RepID=UPI00366A5712